MSALELVYNSHIGRAGRVEWLRADTLRPWRLQRPLNMAAAKKIARDFDPDLIGTLIVSRRGGVDYLLDGQHRWHALVTIMGWGDQNVPCLVYDGLSDPQESKLFHQQGPGVRRQLSGLADFRVRLDMGDPDAVRVQEVVEAQGLELDLTGRKHPNTIRAIRALTETHRLHGAHGLGRALALIRDGLGPDHTAYTTEMIEGAAEFLERYGDQYDRRWFVGKLQKTGIATLTRDTGAMCAALKCSRTTGVGRALLTLYNHGRRANRLPEWENLMNAATPARTASREQAQATKATLTNYPAPPSRTGNGQ